MDLLSLGLYEFQASQGYTKRPCLKEKKTQKLHLYSYLKIGKTGPGTTISLFKTCKRHGGVYTTPIYLNPKIRVLSHLTLKPKESVFNIVWGSPHFNVIF